VAYIYTNNSVINSVGSFFIRSPLSEYSVRSLMIWIYTLLEEKGRWRDGDRVEFPCCVTQGTEKL